MLYIGIPSHNEASTVGLLLWRLRSVMQETAREYEILVFDDGSTDGTAETLRSYAEVLPLTILGGREHVGYGRALEALVRAAAERTRYPRRDGLLIMQADFTDRPEELPEMIKRFEGGADVVVAEREGSQTWPRPARFLHRVAPYLTRAFMRDLVQVKDPYSTLRIYRISALREMLGKLGDAPLLTLDGWAANAELLIRADRFARRVEAVPTHPQYQLRPRETRMRTWGSALDLYRATRAIGSSTRRFTVTG